jgi:hypothetical protein
MLLDFTANSLARVAILESDRITVLVVEAGDIATKLTHPTAFTIQVEGTPHGGRIVFRERHALAGGNLRLILGLTRGDVAQIGHQPIGIRS